jgi:hypothetical protein
MVRHFRNEDAPWLSFDASSPEFVGLEESLALKKLKFLKVTKANGAQLSQVRRRL